MTQVVQFQSLRRDQAEIRSQAANSLVDRIYQSVVFPRPDPAISGHSINHGFTVADWTWFQRCLSDLLGAVRTVNGAPTPTLEAVFKMISTPGATVVYQAFGTPSVTYSWTAVLQMIEDTKNIAHAEKIGDRKGALLAQMTRIQDGTLAAGGLAFAGYRSTAIASAIERTAPSGFNAPTLLGRITYCFVFIGILFFTLYYLISSAVLGVKTVQGARFKQKLEKVAQNKQMQFLRDRLSVDFDKIKASPAELEEEVLSYGVEALKKDLETIGKTRTDKQCRTFLSKQLQQLPSKQIQAIGLLIKQRKLELKKETKLARLTSKECVELIKKNSPDAVNAVKKALEANRASNLTGIGLCMTGAIFMALGLVFATGVGAIICAVMMVLVCASMIKIDSDALKESLTSDEAPRKLDKTLVKISMALCIASIATVIGLVVAGLIVASPYVVIMSALLSLIWLLYNIKTLRVIQEKERRFKAEHPTLEAFNEKKIEQLRSQLAIL